jgi:hypothetical protein
LPTKATQSIKPKMHILNVFSRETFAVFWEISIESTLNFPRIQGWAGAPPRRSRTRVWSITLRAISPPQVYNTSHPSASQNITPVPDDPKFLGTSTVVLIAFVRKFFGKIPPPPRKISKYTQPPGRVVL